MTLFDTHVHLNHSKYKKDKVEVINAARQAGVAYMLNVSYDEKSIAQSIAISRRYPFIYAAIGVHPHYVCDMTQNLLETIEAEYINEREKNNKTVAIGEIGLDYYRDLSPRETQKQWFIEQIRLAKKLKAPIIIHNRDSSEDVVKIVKAEAAGENGGIIHSFSGDKAMLYDMLDAGMYISFSGTVTYNNTENLKEMIKLTPADRLLVETDCPYLPPVPHRGGRNEPAYVIYVAEEAAKIKGMELEELADITARNALKLFGITNG